MASWQDFDDHEKVRARAIEEGLRDREHLAMSGVDAAWDGEKLVYYDGLGPEFDDDWDSPRWMDAVLIVGMVVLVLGAWALVIVAALRVLGRIS